MLKYKDKSVQNQTQQHEAAFLEGDAIALAIEDVIQAEGYSALRGELRPKGLKFIISVNAIRQCWGRHLAKYGSEAPSDHQLQAGQEVLRWLMATIKAVLRHSRMTIQQAFNDRIVRGLVKLHREAESTPDPKVLASSLWMNDFEEIREAISTKSIVDRLREIDLGPLVVLLNEHLSGKSRIRLAGAW